MARYWKITDSFLKEKASVLYEKIKEGFKNNKKFWTDNVPFSWEQYYGGSGFNLCTEVYAVLPKDAAVLKSPPRGWKKSKIYEGAVEPDLRYKEGKQFDKDRQSTRTQIGYHSILSVLGIKHPDMRRFTIPKLHSVSSEVFFISDDQVDLESDTRFEEVTLSYIRKLEK